MFQFDVKKTAVARARFIAWFPLFKYAGVLAWMFFYLWLASLILALFSVLGVVEYSASLQGAVVLLVSCLIFWQIYLFVTYRVLDIKFNVSLREALNNLSEYNIAEFLSPVASKVVQESITVSRKRKLGNVISESLLYALVAHSKEVQLLLFRLGIDHKKLKVNIKNYLEKQQKQPSFPSGYASSFQETIETAANVSLERNHSVIGEKELLVALARHDKFFKQVLIDYDLTYEDVKNITLWLDMVEEKIDRRGKFWEKENLSRFGSIGQDWASGFTIHLDDFSIDWTAVAQRTLFSHIIGHQKEINEVENILAKGESTNVLVVGDDGMGKKSIIEGLAQRCYLGTSLPVLNGKRVVELDMVQLLARVQDQESLEVLLETIFKEALTAGNIILIIDQLDQVIESAAGKLAAVDISPILGKYLNIREFYFIGIMSSEGLRGSLDQNPAMIAYFSKVDVAEISQMETINILQNVALQLEKKHQVLIVYPTIREIINLTDRYFASTPFPKKAIDVLEEAVARVSSLQEKVVLPHHIAKIISDKTHIPVGKMEFKEKSVLLNLEKLIHQRIVGQHEAVEEISIAMRRARSGLENKKRPMGSFLFLGATGVGKTETAKALADIYFGGEDKMIRLDMSEFQSTSDIVRLIGGSGAAESQGLLTTPVREHPFSLVLLDEIEKAHPDILNLFLQVFDEGHLTDGHGRRVIFSNTIIICTSNAGAAEVFSMIESGKPVEKDSLIESLVAKGMFRPELINRFDATVVFHPLSKENLLDIAQLLLESLAKTLKEKEIELTITQPLKEKLVELSYKPEFGARQMRRVLQDTVENNIATALLSDTIAKGSRIEINPEDFQVVLLNNSYVAPE